MSTLLRSIGMSGAIFLTSGSAIGQVVQFASPASGDRWMYPFNFSSGFEGSAPTFGAILQSGFDDRDSQMIVTWETAGAVPAGLGASRYFIESVVVRATVANDLQWRYDGTADSVVNLYDVSDPAYVPDADPGTPVELYGVGFRNLASAATWTETSAFSTGVPNPAPAENHRDLFAAVFDEAGDATDISNQVRQRFDTSAMAIGRTDLVAPGALVPVDTELTFEVNLCDPTVRAYYQRALDLGRLHLAITSLEPAAGGPGGGTGDPAYPRFYTKENVLAAADPLLRVQLELVVRIGEKADVNGDTVVDILDFLDFFAAFSDGDPAADIDGNCVVDILDFLDFFEAFGGG